MKKIDCVYDVLSFNWQTPLVIRDQVKAHFGVELAGGVTFWCEELVREGFAESSRSLDASLMYRRTFRGRAVPNTLRPVAVAVLSLFGG